MHCPTCNSDNVQKLSILYESGTNDIQTSSTTVGAGLGLGHTGGFGSAQTTTRGQSQSKLAQKAAPPAKKNYYPVLAILAGILLFMASSQFMFLFIAVLLIAGGGFLLYKAQIYNNTTWRELYEKWQKMWHCNKCGTIFYY